MTDGGGADRQILARLYAVPRPRVLLVTFQLLPDGESGGAALVAALRRHGIDAMWVSWDDPAVDWASANAVAVRSTWDYHRRTGDFLAWAREVDRATRLLNGADVFTWNADKAYLRDLAGLVPTVPTELLDDAGLVAGLRSALERWGSVVVKPRTGAGGVGVVVAEAVDDDRLEGLVAGPWIVQPLVTSIRTHGERSVYVFGGRAVSQVDKVVGGPSGEIRVHELYGGGSTAAPLDPTLAAVAESAVKAAATLTGRSTSYARVDLVRWQDAWVVSELELVEPGLYLDVDPSNADRFAAHLARELGVARPVFRDATEADVEELVALVESAYRGDASRAGWTTEADLLDGQRTDPEGVREVIAAPRSRLLVAERDGGVDGGADGGADAVGDGAGRAIVACCQLEHRSRPDGERAYFGMFAVSPALQGAGLGTQVMAEAERIAREEWGATAMEMTVISVREDLIAFYERRGYRRTGEMTPFPYGDERFGIPRRDDLQFERLVKPLC